MDLTAYVDALRNSLRTAAAAGGEQAQETARLLADAMEPAVRLAVPGALSGMAAQGPAALDGDVVEIRLRGGEPEVVVVRAAHEAAGHGPAGHAPPRGAAPEGAAHGNVGRISLRLPDGLKARAEAAAGLAGTSLNTWLIRAVSAVLGDPRPQPPPGRAPRRPPPSPARAVTPASPAADPFRRLSPASPRSSDARPHVPRPHRGQAPGDRRPHLRRHGDPGGRRGRRRTGRTRRGPGRRSGAADGPGGDRCRSG